MAYLILSEYVTRFGDQEATRLTNTTPSPTPTYDSAKIQAALDDQSEVVDSYIGKRYVTPVADPPRIIKGWVAALARQQLHVQTGKTVEAVDLAASRAIQQLTQVSKGDLTLPIEEGGTAPTGATGGLAMASNDRPSAVLGRCDLDAFTAPFTGGNRAPEWRR